MTLIKSISGIRGTIGGEVGTNLTPLDIVKFAASFGSWIKSKTKGRTKIVVGRDARISGEMVSNIAISTLNGLGIDIVDLGLSTTPTVEIAVPKEKADGGIIFTASHNPKQWNALKLLNQKGEFVSAKDGAEILEIADESSFHFADVDELGTTVKNNSYLEKHIIEVLNLDLVNVDLVQSKKFKVVVDAVNSTGGLFVPELLKKLGCEVILLYCEPNGKFPHNPEPLPQHLNSIIERIKTEQADFGIVVDPDVDRLAFVCEDGSVFGEEYTLVAVADYVLKHQKGTTVSNLSSSMALKDISEKHKQKYVASEVGEVNVVMEMKKQNAVIGGEGNGGIIYPKSHYGRDALVGIGLFLSHLAEMNISIKSLRKSYPNYHISKNKIDLTPETNVDLILERLKNKFKNQEIDERDGVKISFEKEWVHLRKSNTEPIIRVYSESKDEESANNLAKKIIDLANSMISSRKN